MVISVINRNPGQALRQQGADPGPIASFHIIPWAPAFAGVTNILNQRYKEP